MAVYKSEKNGKPYVYSYPRSRYNNNSSEYNKNYYKEHRDERVKRGKLKRIEKRLQERLDTLEII